MGNLSGLDSNHRSTVFISKCCLWHLVEMRTGHEPFWILIINHPIEDAVAFMNRLLIALGSIMKHMLPSLTIWIPFEQELAKSPNIQLTYPKISRLYNNNMPFVPIQQVGLSICVLDVSLRNLSAVSSIFQRCGPNKLEQQCLQKEGGYKPSHRDDTHVHNELKCSDSTTHLPVFAARSYETSSSQLLISE